MSTTSPDAESFVTFNQVQSRQIMEGQPLPPGVMTPIPKPLVTFYKGEPEALGATQIFVGVVSIVFGILISMTSKIHTRYFDPVTNSGVMFWSGMMYIASGSVTVSAAAKPTVGKVKSSLVMNTIASVFAGVSIILFAINFIPSSFLYNEFCLYNARETCQGRFVASDFVTGILAMQFFFVVLMFSIAISSSAFACKSVCRASFQEVTVVVYQTAPPTTTDPMAFSSVPAPSGGTSGI
ncbi:membrane-spanning 4-domains subfamily A member 4D-like [Rana temporaria]|uniref:membrane-spanning 4-domains subfamily A member 4D-like n=1 Tax=Rana temporaria TaxID=8407 RepID=UPI001AADF4E7|nr:membrane-spanning 4-domains subfamily A member 4D-like [Rana temporaria]